MELTWVIVALVICASAGWLEGYLVQFEAAGFGLLSNIVVGLAGAFMTALLFPRLGASFALFGAILTASIGTVVLLLIVNLVQRLTF